MKCQNREKSRTQQHQLEQAVQNGSFAINVFCAHWMQAHYKRQEPFAD
jgi:hypothetical protein